MPYPETSLTDIEKQNLRTELKQDIRRDATQARLDACTIKKDPQLIDANLTAALAIEQQLNTPVTAPAINPKDCHIGKWNGSIIDGETYKNFFDGSRYDELPPNQSYYLRNIIREKTTDNDNRLAYYLPLIDSIHLLPHTIQSENLYEKEYANQNPMAENSTAYHEALHKRHANHNGMYDVNRSIANTLRTDRLTETTANAVQYLSTANAYTQLKKHGAKTFEYTTNKGGEEKTITMPLENILDMYPGLREAMDGNDFSPDDPKMVRKIVAASAKNWENNYKESYYEQHLSSAAMIYGCQLAPTFSFRLRLANNQKNPDKDFAKLSNEMLQNIYIGNNTTVDLTDCEDLLNTMSAEEAIKLENALKFGVAITNNTELSEENASAVESWLKNNGITSAEEQDKYIKQALTDITSPLAEPSTDQEFQNLFVKVFLASEPSGEEVFAVNEYLEKKGLLTDEEKDKYMKKAFIDIVNRSPEADQKLKALLLGDSSSIKYTDGLVETKIPNTEYSIVTDNNGKTYNIGTLSHFSSRLEEKRQHENTTTNEQTDTKEQTTAIEQTATKEQTAEPQEPVANASYSLSSIQLYLLKERSGR